jgi:hypothetical protein
MKEVHIVIASIEYEGCDVVGAFASKEDAENLVKECEKYDKTVPKHVGYREKAEARKAWLKEFDAWKEKHPAGGGHYDFYSVATHPILGDKDNQHA